MAIVLRLPEPAFTVRGYRMQQNVHPWGADGGSWLDGEPVPDTVEYDIWLDLHNRRYGPSETGQRGAVSFDGLKQGEYKQAVEVIYAKDPGWFDRNGIGVSVPDIDDMGRGEATKQATFDAQAWSLRNLIVARARELNLADGPGEPVPGKRPIPVPPPSRPDNPPISTDPPIGHPLSPLSIRVEELRQIALTWLSLDAPLWVLALFWRRSNGGTWDVIEETAKGALRTVRYLRRLAGDTRAFPPE